MRAVKANKVYKIDEKQMKFYQESGFDILGDDGEVVAYGRGKTVPYGDYMKVVEENKVLKASIEQSDGQDDSQDVLNILTAYAQEHGIDLGRATSVAGIVKKIKEHRAEGGE